MATSAFFGKTAAVDAPRPSAQLASAALQSIVTAAQGTWTSATLSTPANTVLGALGRSWRFPSSRKYLWDRTPAGPTVYLRPKEYLKCLEVHPSVVHAAAASCQDQEHHQEAVLTLLAHTALTPDSRQCRLRLLPRQGSQAPEQGNSQQPVHCTLASLSTAATCHSGHAPDLQTAAVPDPAPLAPVLSHALEHHGPATLNQLVALRCQLGFRADGTCSLAAAALVPATPVGLTPLFGKRLGEGSMMAQRLVRPQATDGSEQLETGVLTLDQGRSLIPLAVHDPEVFSLPLVGVWVRGASCPDHPLVAAACLSFATSRALPDKAVQPDGSFLLLLFPPEGAALPSCYEARLQDDDGRLSCLCLSFQGELLQPRSRQPLPGRSQTVDDVLVLQPQLAADSRAVLLPSHAPSVRTWPDGVAPTASQPTRQLMPSWQSQQQLSNSTDTHTKQVRGEEGKQSQGEGAGRPHSQCHRPVPPSTSARAAAWPTAAPSSTQHGLSLAIPSSQAQHGSSSEAAGLAPSPTPAPRGGLAPTPAPRDSFALNPLYGSEQTRQGQTAQSTSSGASSARAAAEPHRPSAGANLAVAPPCKPHSGQSMCAAPTPLPGSQSGTGVATETYAALPQAYGAPFGAPFEQATPNPWHLAGGSGVPGPTSQGPAGSVAGLGSQPYPPWGGQTATPYLRDAAPTAWSSSTVGGLQNGAAARPLTYSTDSLPGLPAAQLPGRQSLGAAAWATAAPRPSTYSKSRVQPLYNPLAASQVGALTPAAAAAHYSGPGAMPSLLNRQQGVRAGWAAPGPAADSCTWTDSRAMQPKADSNLTHQPTHTQQLPLLQPLQEHTRLPIAAAQQLPSTWSHYMHSDVATGQRHSQHSEGAQQLSDQHTKPGQPAPSQHGQDAMRPMSQPPQPCSALPCRAYSQQGEPWSSLPPQQLQEQGWGSTPDRASNATGQGPGGSAGLVLGDDLPHDIPSLQKEVLYLRHQVRQLEAQLQAALQAAGQQHPQQVPSSSAGHLADTGIQQQQQLDEQQQCSRQQAQVEGRVTERVPSYLPVQPDPVSRNTHGRQQEQAGQERPRLQPRPAHASHAAQLEQRPPSPPALQQPEEQDQRLGARQPHRHSQDDPAALHPHRRYHHRHQEAHLHHRAKADHADPDSDEVDTPPAGHLQLQHSSQHQHQQLQQLSQHQHQLLLTAPSLSGSAWAPGTPPTPGSAGSRGGSSAGSVDSDMPLRYLRTSSKATATGSRQVLPASRRSTAGHSPDRPATSHGVDVGSGRDRLAADTPKVHAPPTQPQHPHSPSHSLGAQGGQPWPDHSDRSYARCSVGEGSPGGSSNSIRYRQVGRKQDGPGLPGCAASPVPAPHAGPRGHGLGWSDSTHTHLATWVARASGNAPELGRWQDEEGADWQSEAGHRGEVGQGMRQSHAAESGGSGRGAAANRGGGAASPASARSRLASAAADDRHFLEPPNRQDRISCGGQSSLDPKARQGQGWQAGPGPSPWRCADQSLLRASVNGSDASGSLQSLTQLAVATLATTRPGRMAAGHGLVAASAGFVGLPGGARPALQPAALTASCQVAGPTPVRTRYEPLADDSDSSDGESDSLLMRKYGLR
ncbi:hypothetical protein V8C86DRAFT_3139572 [Haematococcus lacustris]